MGQVATYVCHYCATQHPEAGKCANCGGQLELSDDGQVNTASDPVFVGVGIFRSGPGEPIRPARLVSIVAILSIAGALALAGTRFMESAMPSPDVVADGSPAAHASQQLSPEQAAELVNSLNAVAISADAPAIRPFVIQAQLAQALATVQPIRMLALEYEAMNGQFPSDVAQLGFAEAELSDGEYIDGVSLGEDGRIVVALSELFGEDRRLALVPEVTMGGLRMKWNCRTTLTAADLGPQTRNLCSPVPDPDF